MFYITAQFLVLLKNGSKRLADLLFWIALFYGYHLFLPNSSISFHNSTLVFFWRLLFTLYPSGLHGARLTPQLKGRQMTSV